MRTIWQTILQYKKWLLGAVLLAAVVKGGLMYQESRTTNQSPPQTAVVEQGDIFSTVSATGTINPVDSVDISSKITGLLQAVNVNENDSVTAGQVLVVLDDARIQTQVSQARERLINAEATYRRTQQLAGIGALSQQQLDTARMDYKVAQANFEDAESQLAETVIKAPISGTVIGKPIPAGQTVAQGISNPMVILTIADLSKMQIETQVDETDIGKVAMGQKVSFTVDAYQNRTFTGVVSKISQKATVQQNVVYYTVLVDVDAPEGLLKPSMTARVSIHSDESRNTMIVPLSALRFDKEQSYVVVYRPDGRMENIAVATGVSSDDRVEIINGLQAGDRVVMGTIKVQAGSGAAAMHGVGRAPRVR